MSTLEYYGNVKTGSIVKVELSKEKIVSINEIRKAYKNPALLIEYKKDASYTPKLRKFLKEQGYSPLLIFNVGRN